MKKNLKESLLQYDEAFATSKLQNETITNFKYTLKTFMDTINEAISNHASEENIKNIINSFLKSNFYINSRFSINTVDKIDSAIMLDGKVKVLIETKKPSNKTEMPSDEDINKKGLWEAIYYYLEHTRKINNNKVLVDNTNEIKRIVITDSRNWLIFDVNDIEKICNDKLEELYIRYKTNNLIFKKDNERFYNEMGKLFSEINIQQKLDYLYFDLKNSYTNTKDLQNIYKILSMEYLIKMPIRQSLKMHMLNNNFYQELLYIMGLKEEKLDNKVLININFNIRNSMAYQVYNFIKNEKGKNENESIEKTFELLIIWINRLLFIKLFEGQLISFNEDTIEYHIIDNTKIQNFKELQLLFFDILGTKKRENNTFSQNFSKIPYLNSSLFERTEIEYEYLQIGALQNEDVQIKSNSILKNYRQNKMPLLQYIFDFLNSYNFTSVDVSDDNGINDKDIIDPTVLGLIFEKLNGYKDGSFYTPSNITERMAKQVIEKTVISKINTELKQNFLNLVEVKNYIGHSLDNAKRINNIISNIKICDPAVGSGHFLVSSLNRIIFIKKYLGVLFKCNSNELLTECNIKIEDDTLVVVDGQNHHFRYDKTNYLSQQIQETLFNEKRKIIEDCLFGVDINPKAVLICQLRLWIELLKNAYYKNDVMETLPNIDIDIKCGNSLVSRLPYEVGQKLKTKNGSLTKEANKLLVEYKKKVKEYKSINDKNKKREISNVIKNLNKSILQECQQISFFDDVVSNHEYSLYKNSLEWSYAFPEIVDDKGTFLGFDCIIGNPPYLQLSKIKDIPNEYKQYLKDTYNTSGGRLNLYIFMLHLGYNLLKQNGFLSFIVPNTLLTQDYYEYTRKLLIYNTKIEEIIDYQGMAFDNAIVENITLTIKKEQIEDYVIDIFNGEASDIRELKQINVNKFKENHKFSFSIYSNDFINRMFKDTPPLDYYCDVNQGIALKGDKNASITKEYNPDYYPLLDGRNINKYSINWDKKYLVYNLKNIHSCKRKDIFENEEKLLFRRVASDLIFTYDNNKYFTLNTLVVVNKKKDEQFCNINLKYILAILNSKLLNYIYKNKFKSTKKVFSEIQANSVKKLPIKIDMNQDKYVNLVDQLLAGNGNKDKIMKEIDEFVYELYGLTEKEIKMIENN